MTPQISDAVERYQRREAGYTTLARSIGLTWFTFRHILDAYGVKPWPRGSVLAAPTEQRNKEIICRAKAGELYEDIGRDYGITKLRVYAICKENGIPPQPENWRKK